MSEPGKLPTIEEALEQVTENQPFVKDPSTKSTVEELTTAIKADEVFAKSAKTRDDLDLAKRKVELARIISDDSINKLKGELEWTKQQIQLLLDQLAEAPGDVAMNDLVTTLKQVLDGNTNPTHIILTRKSAMDTLAML